MYFSKDFHQIVGGLRGEMGVSLSEFAGGGWEGDRRQNMVGVWLSRQGFRYLLAHKGHPRDPRMKR